MTANAVGKEAPMSDQGNWGWWDPDPVRRRSNVLATMAWTSGTIAFFTGVGAALQAKTQLLVGGVGTTSLAYLVLWSILALMATTVAAAAAVGAALLNGVAEAKGPPVTTANELAEASDGQTP
jgi:hypothetical protein